MNTQLLLKMDRPHLRQTVIAAAVTAALGLGPSPIQAADAEEKKNPGGGDVRVLSVPHEVESPGVDVSDARPPLRITVDDEVVIDQPGISDIGTDFELDRVDIQIQYDTLDQTRRLATSVWPDVAVSGEPLRFKAINNYPHWIKQAEIRLFEPGESAEAPPTAVLPLDTNGEVEYTPDQAYWKEHKLRYVLRVYDEEGRFDETRPLDLDILDERDWPYRAGKEWLEERPDGTPDPEMELQQARSANHLAKRTIPVFGGMVTVNGRNIPKGQKVYVMGREAAIDPFGTFVVEEVMTTGSHVVNVEVRDESGKATKFERSLYIPDQEWFYVAIGDLTIGKNNADGPAALVTQDETHYDESGYVDARAGFYAKGKIKGEYLITAQLDTGEESLEDILDNLDDKDPRQLLRQIDSEDHYPVFGDDGTTNEDTPSQGKFYVRVERGNSHVLWGNFRTNLEATELVQAERGLYGAELNWQSDSVTGFGESSTKVQGFASEATTLHKREEFRGTSGSLFYLEQREISIGSEKVTIEIRDANTGVVLGVRELDEGQDYHIDPLQGRLSLREPLHANAASAAVVRTGSLGGNPQYLVVRYEYAPSATSLQEPTVGGRLSHWLNDYIQVGVIGAHDEDGAGNDHDQAGVDGTLRYSAGTYLKGQVAKTKNPGVGEKISDDGGFTFTQIAQDRTAGVEGDAVYVEGAVDLRDPFGLEKSPGDVRAYYSEKSKGFSGAGHLTDEHTTTLGVSSRLHLDDNTDLRASYDTVEEGDTQMIETARLGLDHQFDEHWSAGVEVLNEERERNSPSTTASITEQGSRTDASVRLAYDSLDDWNAYTFVQGTLDVDQGRNDNGRVGVGGQVDVNDRLSLTGEGSIGDNGTGFQAGSIFRYNDRSELYASYQMDGDRTDDGRYFKNRSFVTGSRTRYSDSLSVFTERRSAEADFEDRSSLTNAYGLKYTPTDEWTFGFDTEVGTVHEITGDKDREAGGVSVAFSNERVRLSTGLEGRIDTSTTERRKAIYWRNNLNVKVDEDWRATGRLNYADSDSNTAGDGGFVEFSTGGAYRPVDNDRLNGLIKYTYIENRPSPAQLDALGNSSTYQQRSHVFAIDTLYDLNEEFTVGGKYALRYGELRTGPGADWSDNDAQLLVLRGDYHWVHNWDALLEYRIMHISDASDTLQGILLAVYRHFGENVKAGVGYNFTDFSDDLTDLSFDNSGFFFNVIGKF
ncbi:MAG: OmpA family protein [Gammaproteobacteria bacterium]